MLSELVVKNFGIIDHATLSFDSGFTVLTGETGAGKSLIVEALQLIIGSRANQRMIRSCANEAKISARFDVSDQKRFQEILTEDQFDISENQVIIKRIISRDGKSKIYLNQEMITASKLSEYKDYLVDIYGQHDTEQLFQPAKQLDLLDKFNSSDLLAEEVGILYKKVGRLRERIDKFHSNKMENARKIDLYRFQLDEINKAELTHGIDERLKLEYQKVSQVSFLINSSMELINIIDDADNSLINLMSDAKSILTKMIKTDQSLEESAKNLEESLFLIEEVGRSISRYKDSLDDDPSNLMELENRLDYINSLKMKYGETIESILLYKDKIETELNEILQDSSDVADLEEEVAKVEARLFAKVIKLDEKRVRGGSIFANKIEQSLKELGIVSAKVEFGFRYDEDQKSRFIKDGKRIKISQKGIARVEILFSPNSGEPLLPLAKIGSGGELSRTMLAIKAAMIGVDDDKRSMVFDEIDTGIGGETADKVGEKLNRLAKYNSVIVVTHLPQVARFADSHILIKKIESDNKTEILLKELDRKERVKELARMAGGSKAVREAINWAKEALKE